MKQTEVGLIPDDWEVKEFKNVTNRITVGIANSATHAYADHGIIMFRNQNIKENKLDLDDLIYIKKSFADKYQNKRLLENDLLIARTGYPGTTCVVPSEYQGSQTFTTLIASPNKDYVNSYYVAYYFNSQYGKKMFSAAQIGGAQKNVNATTLANIIIPLPPLEEQQRIAKALSDVDALITITEKLIQKKKNIKQSAMQNLLTGKKRLPGFAKSTEYKQTELGLIPEDWEMKKLSEFGTFSKGSGISREESNTGEYPAVRYGELYTTHNDYIKSFYSHISYELASKSKKINKGDLLFTCSGETKEDIGKCVAFIGNEKAYAGGDLLILSPTVNIDSLFYGFLLNTTVAVKQKSSMAQGDAVVHISAESIGKIRVPFPSKEEQTAIANVLSSMDKEIETLNTKLEKYRNLKTAMMQQLLTGKIRL